MADPDNLEYYIKFPNPNFNYNQHNNDSDFVFVVDEDKIPVILLFGWAGCEDKYLSKYSQIYEEKGLITIRYTAPIKCLFWKRYRMIAIADKILKLLLDLNFESHPVIVHCFSNGGAFLYHNFSLASEKSTQQIQIKGVIFDSAPGKRRILSLYKAISAILGGNIFYNFSISVFMTMFLSVIWMYEVCKNWIFPSDTYQSHLWENLLQEKNMWPQHFIYSKADNLIPYEDIEYFAEYRKNKGVEVSTLCFEKSPHVKHYSCHREEYVNSVCSFINKCLNGKTI
ncbi:transmembrane protein 53 isoform X1 [Agrilus planipennis]|uniref:Transmembrane protein 53 isoform X1 n=1 Tax=Agrilus planipennis TaxID=224129 RepID=A0A1W4XVQ5_AGRPL|nr:transmembrane protein 53 isoform X1 [Agrilus planipennis]